MIKFRNSLVILALMLLVACNFNFLKSGPSEMELSLLQAANNGDYQTVQKLLKKGVNVNVKNSNGMTPLHYASFKGHFDTVRLLLQNGADVNIEAKGWTSVEMAFARNHVQLAELLIESNSGFLEAANSGDYQRVKQLLEKGWDVNTKDGEAWTLLHHAAINGHTNIAKFLLEKGANIDTKDKEDWTPLMVASANGQTNIAKFLIQKGANINVADKNGMTPLHSAAINGYIDLAIILLEKGVNVKTKNKDGMTPLDLALSLNRTKMVELLTIKSSFSRTKMVELVTTKGSFFFGITTNKYKESQNMEYACKSEFGANSRVADWSDIKSYYVSSKTFSEFFVNLNLVPYKSSGWRELGAFVKNYGKGIYSGDRHYFITRHDGNRPSHYLSHDNINNRELDLGSWRGTGHVLCVK